MVRTMCQATQRVSLEGVAHGRQVGDAVGVAGGPDDAR